MAYETRRFNLPFTRTLPIIPILSRINTFPRIDTWEIKTIILFDSIIIIIIHTSTSIRPKIRFELKAESLPIISLGNNESRL